MGTKFDDITSNKIKGENDMLYTNAVKLKNGEIVSNMDTTTFDSYVNIPMTSIPVPGYISVEVAYLMRDINGNILQSKDGIEINYIPLKNMLTGCR